MARRQADAGSQDEANGPSAERDLLSLARLLHYTKCEADALGQTAAAALVDAALLSLTVNSSPVSAAASGSRLRGLLTDQPPPQTRKFC